MASNSSAARRACLARARPEVSSQTLRPAPRSIWAMAAHSGLSSGSPPESSTTWVCSRVKLGSRRVTAVKIHVIPAMPPVVAGDAAGVAAIRQIQGDQGQPGEGRSNGECFSGQWYSLIQ